MASYIAGFGAEPTSQAQPFSLAVLAGSTPAEIAQQQGEEAAAQFRAQRARPPQPLRGPLQLIEHTRTSLEQSLAAYRRSEREQAYDLSVGAYLEGFELVESALNNLDPLQRKATERR